MAPRLGAVLERLAPGADPRWLDALIAIVPRDPKSALPALGRLQDPRAIPFLIALAKNPPNDTVLALAFSALAELKAREALPLMLKWIRANLEGRVIASVIGSVGELGDRDAISELNSIANRSGTSSFLQQLIETNVRKLEGSR